MLNGKSHDTSMGFSPVDGLVMGTRCGNVDPSAITFIGEKEGMSYAEVNEMMNKKSGVWGAHRPFERHARHRPRLRRREPRAILARDMHYGRIRKFVGEYAAEMGGVDLIVFTGGVGENSCEMRETVCTGLEFMGVEFDRAANKGRPRRGQNPFETLLAGQGRRHRHRRGTGHRHRHVQSGKINKKQNTTMIQHLTEIVDEARKRGKNGWP